MFFDLHGVGQLGDRDMLLIDSNPDVIGCYQTVRARPDEHSAEARSAGLRAIRAPARRATNRKPVRRGVVDE